VLGVVFDSLPCLHLRPTELLSSPCCQTRLSFDSLHHTLSPIGRDRDSVLEVPLFTAEFAVASADAVVRTVDYPVVAAVGLCWILPLCLRFSRQSHWFCLRCVIGSKSLVSWLLLARSLTAVPKSTADTSTDQIQPNSIHPIIDLQTLQTSEHSNPNGAFHSSNSNRIPGKVNKSSQCRPSY